MNKPRNRLDESLPSHRPVNIVQQSKETSWKADLAWELATSACMLRIVVMPNFVERRDSNAQFGLTYDISGTIPPISFVTDAGQRDDPVGSSSNNDPRHKIQVHGANEWAPQAANDP